MMPQSAEADRTNTVTDSQGHQHIAVQVEKARAAEKPGFVRYILAISVGLAIVAMALILIFFVR